MYRDYTGPARMHNPISKRDLTDYGRMSSEVTVYQMAPEELERYRQMKPPTKSDGLPYHRPIGGFTNDREKQNRKRGGKGA